MTTFGNPILHRLGVTQFWKITDYTLGNKDRFLNRFVLFIFIHKLFFFFHRKMRWDFFFEIYFAMQRLDISYPEFFFWDVFSTHVV